MHKLIAGLAIATVLAGCSSGVKPVDPIDALMQRYSGDVPGASLLVIKDGKAIVNRSYGLSNVEDHDDAAPATNYRLASVSKQFTAAAILLLAENGRLHLDDTARRWLPSLPEVTAGVTLRQLLTHTGGLVDYEDLIPAGTTDQVSDQDVLRMLSATAKTYFAPGTAYRYSNTGYVLLGLVVEQASGVSLPLFLQQHIFQPLHMDHTLLYERGGPPIDHRAYGYSEENGHWTRTDQSVTSATRGDGGIYSSVEDLAKWDAALYDNRLLSDASRNLAFTAHVKVTGEPYEAGYGYGWRITGDTLWHSGESIGFRNVIVRWPKQHLTVILLSNRNDPEPYRSALAIAQPYLQEP
ncbi:serine hydrolase [Rhodanobacter sp. AS-Z3]|uniref:serine hydrolase domain-containing protein n=1 Tax=Rhodanobacter sp. AS-Z3 TaxID=3031330 RepID=UPI0024796C5C|nr:serine hydrolase domain-containing protein [Rhodanobacter sp. AS-Z3]WEN16025.1 serine hydrolase [Rhodanobacter sp. AS-Z3]